MVYLWMMNFTNELVIYLKESLLSVPEPPMRPSFKAPVFTDSILYLKSSQIILTQADCPIA